MPQQEMGDPNERRLRAVVESAPSGLLMVDSKGTIVLVNAEIERLFGVPRHEMLGKPVEMLLPARFRGAHPMWRGQFHSNPSARSMGAGRELHALRGDGSEFPVEIGLTPVATADGLFVIGSIVDITERRRAESERARLEEQLRQSQKMEALGTLAGGVAHDFNNVLGVMMGFAELLRGAVQHDPSARGDVEELLQAAARGKELVDRILRFSRRQEVDKRPTDVATAIRETEKLLRATISPNITIETRVTEDRMRVLGDSTSIQHVLMNLATNAVYAMPNGGLLSLEADACYVRDSDAMARPTLHEGRYVRLIVRDTGTGMDEATRQKAFEPFFSGKPVGQGTGLGLALVHGIVRDHGGDVSITSELHRGTSVECLFPALETAADARPEPPLSAPRGNGEHVLYLDDESWLTTIARRHLEALNYRVTVESNPFVALDLFRIDPDSYDLVLTDYLMPRMNGLQFARALQSVRPGTPVALLSGYIGEFTSAELASAGIAQLLQKPVSGIELAHAAHSCIANARKRRGAPGTT
jgi:PAS domain S-box-containing protein